MKNLFITALVTCLIIYSSCDTSNPSQSNNSNWTVGATSYQGPSATRVGSTQLYAASGSSGNSMAVFFNQFPTASGTYKVVSEDLAASNGITNGTLAVEFNIGARDAYLSEGNANDTAHVNVVGGQITVTVPNISTYHYAGGPLLDTTVCHGTIAE